MKLCIVFDGPPGPESGRFIEVENENGRGLRAGEWRERPDGLWSLDIDLDTVGGKVAASLLNPIEDGTVRDG